MLRASPQFTNRYQRTATRWAVSGFDDGMLRYRVPVLAKRLSTFRSDRDAFAAILDDPKYLVDDQFLLRGGGPKTDGPEPGDEVVVTNVGGDQRTLVVAGVLKSDAIFQGSLWSKQAMTDFLAPATAEMLCLPPGRERNAHAGGGRGPFARGRHRHQRHRRARFDALVADELGRTTSFMRLLEGYLGFGLLIGIAGLGVVMVRAARERRHEIGTLRAMGLQGRVVSQAFLIEALFIAGGGVAIGTSLALITAYQVVVNSSAFSLSSDSFTIAWVPLILIAIVPTFFAPWSASQPARAVGRIRPAVALRIAD